jgi:phospholipid/cholesterol/gamma-HCH transport system permease protein
MAVVTSARIIYATSNPEVCSEWPSPDTLTNDSNTPPGWVFKQRRQTAEYIVAGGEWTVAHAGALNTQMNSLHLDANREVLLDASGLTNFDIVGAWLLRRITQRAHVHRVISLAPRFQSIVDLLEETFTEFNSQSHKGASASYGAPLVRHIGTFCVWLARQLSALISYLGLVTIESCKTALNLRRMRVPALLNSVRETGLNALPIVGLLSFAIGIVLAYQGAEQLKKFGAVQLTINFLGIGTLRELGGLMAAIMLAGRSGSAFTAQIGTMKLNQEIDAIEVLGLETISVLVLPRILGLLIALPLLTLYSDLMSILGGAALCRFYLHISLVSFTHQLQTALSVRHLMIGLVKAPVFACIIGFIGCFEGMQVSRHAASVGQLTTRSVVEAIFLVIVVDAGFSILFSVMGI